eukprot:80714_1
MTELLIYGFIRAFQKQSELSMPVPDDVQNLIVQFYQLTCLVIDNGSHAMKIGFTENDIPIIFPTIVGRNMHPGHQGVLVGMAQNHTYVGYDAKAKPWRYYPIQHGVVTSWEHMEKIWDKTFNEELMVSPKGCNVLLTEKPLNPKANREKMTQIMFETYNVNGLYIAVDAMLSLYASGRCTGVVMDCGDGVSHTVPIYEGYVLQNAVRLNDTGGAGRGLTDYLMNIMCERGYSFTTIAEREIVKDIKEKWCYVALDYDSEGVIGQTSSDMEKNYELPDGQVITIGNERFRCMEPLFKPSLRGFESEGIIHILYGSIMKCHTDLRPEMFKNILLSGGCCNAPGMSERVTKEIKALAPDSMTVNVIDMYEKNKAHLAWIGGAMLSSQQCFIDLMITAEEYEELGPGIVHRKCF